MLLIIIGLIVVGYILVMAVQMLRYGTAARAAAKITKPYTRIPKDASQHVLVLGDSTMYGAGTKNPDLTVSGLLADKYPKASVETLAKNGAKVKGLHEQLSKVRYQQYDLILIGIGGNDIVQLSTYSSVRRELVAFLTRISKISPQIILCHSANIGNIGFFPFPLNYFYDYRSRQLSKQYKDVAVQFPNITYVNFYRPLHNDHYDKTTRKKFIADDAFHPNEYANKYFFDLIWLEVEKSRRNP